MVEQLGLRKSYQHIKQHKMASILEFIPLSNFGFKGKRPPLTNFGNPQSTQHYTSSLNGAPASKFKPSAYDLDARTPKKYLDNPPK